MTTTTQLLSAAEVAAMLGVTVRTLRTYRHKNIVPKPIKFERQIRWDADVITRWLQRRTQE